MITYSFFLFFSLGSFFFLRKKERKNKKRDLIQFIQYYTIAGDCLTWW